MNQLKKSVGKSVVGKVENAHFAMITVLKDIAAETTTETTEIVPTQQLPLLDINIIAVFINQHQVKF